MTGRCGDCVQDVDLTEGGRLGDHGEPACPGAGDYPMRPPGPLVPAPGRAVYAPGSAFESCPAATGDITGDPIFQCRQFPDGAHRCGEPRGGTHCPDVHRCTCGTTWRSTYSYIPRMVTNDNRD